MEYSGTIPVTQNVPAAELDGTGNVDLDVNVELDASSEWPLDQASVKFQRILEF